MAIPLVVYYIHGQLRGVLSSTIKKFFGVTERMVYYFLLLFPRASKWVHLCTFAGTKNITLEICV